MSSFVYSGGEPWLGGGGRRPVHYFHAVRQLIPPTSEPIALSDVHLQSRISTTAEDALLQTYIVAAREYCESMTLKVLRPQTWRLTLTQWPDSSYIQLPINPAQSIVQFAYQDTSGNITLMVEGTDYFFDNEARQAQLVLPFGVPWPAVVLNTANAITIDYLAGYPYYSATVNTDATGKIVTATAGTPFDISLVGFPITIAGTQYVVASYISPTSLTLVSGLPNLSGVAFLYDGIPEKFRLAMKLLIGHWYENRESVVVGHTSTISTKIAIATESLLSMEAAYRF